MICFNLQTKQNNKISSRKKNQLFFEIGQFERGPFPGLLLCPLLGVVAWSLGGPDLLSWTLFGLFCEDLPSDDKDVSFWMEKEHLGREEVGLRDKEDEES